MSRPAAKSVVAALGAGVLNVAVVLALYRSGAYPALESAAATARLAGTGFTLGFVAVLVTAHTRLVSPAAGFLGVLATTAYLELSTPRPEWDELGGHVVVHGPTHVSSYANTWYVWAALFLYAGVVEFGIRRGYGVGDGGLRDLPDLPLSRYAVAWTVAGFSGFVGVATMRVVLRAGMPPGWLSLVVLGVATLVAAVPLAALLTRGMLLPMVLFAPVVPYLLGMEAFVTTDSPVHVLLFGPYAAVLLVAWGLEAAVRSRVRGGDRGTFDRREAG